ncbi:acyltransferase [Vibrio parahaemolyticus]|nr:acyltransferase [Vibrio parahaemolyticus]
MFHNLKLLYSWLIKLLMFWLPDQNHIMRIRGKLYSLAMPCNPKNFQVSSTATIKNLENLQVGNNVYLAPGSIINAIDNVILGDEVMIAFNSVVNSGNHTMHNGSYRFGDSNKKPIQIGKGSWIAANCTVVAGTVIGKGCLIAANSVAKGSCLDYGVYSGVPIKLVRLIDKFK